MQLKHGDFFSGVNMWARAADLAGMQSVFAAEINKDRLKVTARNFPDLLQLGDISQVDGTKIPPVDVISFSSPCQDLSLAGKREGFKGERSSLFFEAMRVIREMREATGGEYPKVIIWENVPGALSSNKGADFRAVLESFEENGFVADITILDAQHMGVPQRRRRLFAVCVSTHYILKARTPLSLSIITQLLTEILQYALTVQLSVSDIGRQKLDLHQKNQIKDGLQRRMSLFGITLAEDWLKLVQSWEEMQATQQSGPEKKEFNFTKMPNLENIMDTWLRETSTTTSGKRPFSILQLWRIILDDLYAAMNLSTISTATNLTTQSKIYICSLINLHMAGRIAQSRLCSLNLLTEELSGLTGMKECMNYVREASNNLFAGMEWIYRWNDYLERASDCAEQIERYFRERSSEQVLPQCESLHGHPAEGGEAREEAAAAAGSGAPGAGRTVYYDSGPGFITEGVGCLRAEGENRPSRPTHTVLEPIPYKVSGQRYVTEGIGCIRANGQGPYDNFVLDPTVCRMRSFGDYEIDGTAATLKKGGYKNDMDVVVEAYDMTHADEVMRPLPEGKVNCLNARMGTGGNQVPVILEPQAVVKPTTGSGGQITSTLFAAYGTKWNGNSGAYTGDHFVLEPQAFGPNGQSDIAHALRSQASRADKPSSTTYAVESYDPKDLGRREATFRDITPTLKARMGTGGNNIPCVKIGYRVRRLTETECEKLQGMPPNWTAGISMSARYSAIGDSLAGPCVNWIMEQVAKYLSKEKENGKIICKSPQ